MRPLEFSHYSDPLDLLRRFIQTPMKATYRLDGARVAAFCGIGNPDAFRRTLTNLGMNLVDWRVFPDHHSYTRADVESLGTSTLKSWQTESLNAISGPGDEVRIPAQPCSRSPIMV